jgi:hypothetical protein
MVLSSTAIFLAVAFWLAIKYGEHRHSSHLERKSPPNIDWQGGICPIALRITVFMKKQKGFDSAPRTEYTDCE